MRKRYRGWGVWITVVLAGHALAMGLDPIGPRPVIEGTIHFDLYADYLILAQGSAGPLKGLTFLVDTGASPTVLDTRIARKLHLEERAAGLRVVGGPVAAARATVSSLSLGPVHCEDVSVSVTDLSFLQRTLPVRIDGVIGFDVLGQSAFVIDYRARSIHFGPLPAMPNALPLLMSDGLGFVQAQVNGAPAKLLVDTGASSLTLFARPATLQPAGLTVSQRRTAAHPIGTFDHRQVSLRSLRLGATDFARQSLSIVSGEGQPAYAFDGLLSPAALGMIRVAIDPARGTMAFTR